MPGRTKNGGGGEGITYKCILFHQSTERPHSRSGVCMYVEERWVKALRSLENLADKERFQFLFDWPASETVEKSEGGRKEPAAEQFCNVSNWQALKASPPPPSGTQTAGADTPERP